MGAQCKMGYIAMHGDGMEANMPESHRWFLRAAEAGDATAQRAMGINLYYGAVGMPSDKAAAARWLHQAAAQGDAEAQELIEKKQIPAP